MSKTRAQVISRALRDIRVVAVDEAADADMEADVGDVLDALFQEIEYYKDVTWTLATVPDNAFLGLANLLAVEVAPTYNKAPPMRRSDAWLRLMAVIRPDDREDYRDIDESGTVDADEADAGERARYY